MQIKQTGVLFAAAGAELVWPWEQEPAATDEEMAGARSRLAQRSGVPD